MKIILIFGLTNQLKMNLNILAYLIYGCFTVYTIAFIGKILHRNGRHYILMIFDDERFGDFLNNCLLAGYYLLNIGWVFITINQWENIENTTHLVEIIGYKSGYILLILGFIHWMNIMALYAYAYIKRNIFFRQK